MTDDLEDRLDPVSLELDCPHYPGQPVLQKACTKCNRVVEPEPDFYDENQLVFPTSSPPLPEPIKISVAFFFTEVDTLVLEGGLQTLSFGHEGWLCSFSTDANLVPPVVLRAAKDGILGARIVLPEGVVELCKNIDCTASFSYGVASFTVTSDEARYV